MKILKKVLLILIVTIACVIINYTVSNATSTIKVTATTLNLRQKPSTSSTVLAILSKGQECEVLEELDEWYKIKYKTYTGYVSKDYVKYQEDTTTVDVPTQEEPKQENTTNAVIKTEIEVVSGKVSKTSDVKILPLINSSVIGSISKNAKVTIVAEMNGWTYLQTDNISGWIRSEAITDKKTVITEVSNTNNDSNASNVDNSNNNTDNDATTNNNSTDNNGNDNNTNNNDKDDKTTTNNNSYTAKTMYINDSYVNVREKPSTSAKVIMVVSLNTKFTVIGEDGEFYKVKTSSGDAYVAKRLLSNEKTSTTSRGGVTPTSTTTTQKNNSTNNTVAASATSTNTTSTTTVSSTPTNTTATATTTADIVTTQNSSKGEEIVAYAKTFLGVPYIYGGASPSGFDCSGFTMYVYKHFGISMRHGAQAQAKIGKAVNVDKKSASSIKQNLQAGDLIFFLDDSTMSEIGHVGLYIGDGKFIHASSGTGHCVKINSLLPGEYYNTRYYSARRMI